MNQYSYGTIAIVFDGGGRRVVIHQEDALPDTARIGVIDGIVGSRRRRRRRRRLSRSRPILLGAPVLASSSSVAIVVPLRRRRRRRRRPAVAVVVRSSSILPPLLLGALVARGRRRRRRRVRPIVRRGCDACRARVRIGSGGGTRYVPPRRARGERDGEHGRDQGIVQEGAR